MVVELPPVVGILVVPDVDEVVAPLLVAVVDDDGVEVVRSALALPSGFVFNADSVLLELYDLLSYLEHFLLSILNQRVLQVVTGRYFLRYGRIE